MINLEKILRNWRMNEKDIVEQFHKDTIRQIYKVNNSKQDFVLKGIPETVSENEIRNNVQAHLFLGNEKEIAPKIYKTIEGSFYIHSDGYWFYLMEYIDGRSMDETPEDEFLIGRLAKKLHSYTGYSVKSSMSQSTERFYEWFSERAFKKEFDSILDSLPDFLEYDQCLIHSDIGPHNVMLRNNGDLVFIDLDNTGIGSRYLDLGWPFIMQFVDYDHNTEEMRYRFGLAEMFLDGYYKDELIKRSEYDLIWNGAIYMHIAYMQCYGPDAVESLWNILTFGMKQKEILWEKLQKNNKVSEEM